ncbi:sigma-70 family RNA polymerase sigma factor [Aquabacterium sp.]|uniref:RNA polymerase sigma factor n=1 Tax=Aquabacterium sp. TaxID=1872578 RepID=UPI0025B8DFDD|nr:sigma-70 family RNA polymerase sigma factor [Aquabacterium sp.]
MDAVSRLGRWLALRPRTAEPPPGPPETPDWQRWRRACAGCEHSARELVRELAPQAQGLAMQMLRRREDAQDVVQEAFIRLWQSQPADTRSARLSTYFHTIVLNRCRSLLRSRQAEVTDDGDIGALADGAPLLWGGDAPPPDDPVRGHALQAALAALPNRHRMALVMWAYADASVPDIARFLDIDANAAHQLLHRAKAGLRQRLERGAP